MNRFFSRLGIAAALLLAAELVDWLASEIAWKRFERRQHATS